MKVDEIVKRLRNKYEEGSLSREVQESKDLLVEETGQDWGFWADQERDSGWLLKTTLIFEAGSLELGAIYSPDDRDFLFFKWGGEIYFKKFSATLRHYYDYRWGHYCAEI